MGFWGMSKFFKFVLPMNLIIGSIVVVIALVAYQKTKSAERKPDTKKAILVDTISF